MRNKIIAWAIRWRRACAEGIAPFNMLDNNERVGTDRIDSFRMLGEQRVQYDTTVR